MARNHFVPLLLALAIATPTKADGPRNWDFTYSLTNHHHEFEIAYLPFFVEARPQRLFANLRASLGVVQRHDQGSPGVRLHVDGCAGGRTWYATGGLFLASGARIGTGLGLRLGGGLCFSDQLKMGIVTDVVAGSEGSNGSIGLQLGFSF